MKSIGIVLIITGIISLMYIGYTFTTEEKLVDLGPVKIMKENRHSLNWSPIAGCILILSGIGVMWVDKKGSAIK
jgi:hypothetical protein